MVVSKYNYFKTPFNGLKQIGFQMGFDTIYDMKFIFL